MPIAPMNQNEEAYLKKYRALADQRSKIEGMIGSLSGICQSLKDWQKTAAALCMPGGDPAWADDRLMELSALKSHLVVYYQQSEEIRKAWGLLAPDEKLGFSDPNTFRTVG